MNRSPAFIEGSRLLMEQLALKPGDTFPLRSRSHPRTKRYQMLVTPEGFVVHQGEGCEDEEFRGPGGCWHSQESERYVTKAIEVYQPQVIVPSRIDFSAEQLKTITDVICVDSDGRTAPAAFVQLFLAACRHSGLDPFLRQIYALNIRGRWSMFVGIDGYRVISERTGLDEGMDGPQWSDDGTTWYDYPFSDDPKFCRVAIWRKGVPRAFIAVLTMKSRKVETSDSWKKDAPGMLAKCTEALARRRAFPADMAVIPEDAVFEDADGAPITKAEVPSGEWREVADGEQQQETGPAVEQGAASPPPAAPPPITAAQKQAVVKGLQYVAGLGKAATDVAYKHLRATWPHCFGTMSNNVNALSSSDAEGVLSYIKALQGATGQGRATDRGEPFGEQASERRPDSPSESASATANPAPSSSCPKGGEHEPQYDEKSTVMRCSKCGLALEGPDAQTDPDDLPFDNDPAKDEPAKLPI